MVESNNVSYYELDRYCKGLAGLFPDELLTLSDEEYKALKEKERERDDYSQC